MMTNISAFISELIRDANQIDRLGDFEERRMLERAVTTILQIREIIGIPSDPDVRDVVVDMQITAAMIESGRADDERVKAALLKAATVLRTLKIILDARDKAIQGTTQ